MEKYYLNKLKTLERILKATTENKRKILVYSAQDDGKIKANIESCGGRGFENTILFDSIKDLEKYICGQDITFSITGISIDCI